MKKLFLFFTVFFLPICLEAKEPAYTRDYGQCYCYGAAGYEHGGLGVSYRKQWGHFGLGADLKGGGTSVTFDACTFNPTITIEANVYYFSGLNPKNAGPYFQTGLGALYGIIPYIPLRLGVQDHRGFIDAGVKMYMGIIPIPEARAGFKVRY